MTVTKPPVGWYWAAGAVALVEIVGAVLWGLASYAAIGDRVDGFARDALPGQVVVVGAVSATGVAAAVGAVVLLFASVGAGTLIALVTLVLRNRHMGRQPPVESAPRTPAGVA